MGNRHDKLLRRAEVLLAVEQKVKIKQAAIKCTRSLTLSAGTELLHRKESTKKNVADCC